MLRGCHFDAASTFEDEENLQSNVAAEDVSSSCSGILSCSKADGLKFGSPRALLLLLLS